MFAGDENSSVKVAESTPTEGAIANTSKPASTTADIVPPIQSVTDEPNLLAMSALERIQRADQIRNAAIAELKEERKTYERKIAEIDAILGVSPETSNQKELPGFMRKPAKEGKGRGKKGEDRSEKILDFLKKNPGSTAKDLSKSIGIGYQTIVKDLEKLESKLRTEGQRPIQYSLK